MNRFYDKALNWLITFGPRILLAVIMLIIGFWLIAKFRNLLHRILVGKRIDASLRPFLTGTVSIALQVLLVFAVMQIVGIQLTVFAALVGAFGVAAGLALSGTLQNFTSGILILLLKPFRVGDNIIAQSIEGTVTTIRIFYTVVLTFDNRTVIFPNNKLSNEIITNLSREGKRRLDIEVTLKYDMPYEKIKTGIEKLFDGKNDFLKEPPFRIGISSFGDDGYRIMINAWSKAHGFTDNKMILQEKILKVITDAGAELPA